MCRGGGCGGQGCRHRTAVGGVNPLLFRREVDDAGAEAGDDLLADGGLLCTGFGGKASDEASDAASSEDSVDFAGESTLPTHKISIRRGHC